ncbi:MAG: glycine cleavage T C-terminal barrel domain-containing protein [Gemmatimonadota bacterium]|nr:glycine cleavage T C-terminal barrel domain-containing protein [Gemmatimonadota bacterium]
MTSPRAAPRGPLVYRDPARTAWRVSGAGAARALHGLLTNDILAPAPGAAISCLVLDPRGRTLADVRVLKGEAGLVLDLPAAAAEALAAHFARYLPPRLARTEPLEGAVLVRVLGPEADAAAREAVGAGDGPEPGRFVPFGGGGTDHGPGGAASAGTPDRPQAAGAADDAAGPAGFLVGRWPDEGGGIDVLLLRAADAGQRLERAAAARGGGPLDDDAWEAWRIERGIPEFGRDFDAANLPQETGLAARTVSFEKGCYTGQEVVARIHYRGHVNRHLRGLRFPAGAAPPVGASMYLGEKEIGRVTSTARSPSLGPIGLGMVRREVAPGDCVGLAPGGPADIEVVEFPFTSA